VGASRGLGYAMAEEFLSRDWNVIVSRHVIPLIGEQWC